MSENSSSTSADSLSSEKIQEYEEVLGTHSKKLVEGIDFKRMMEDMDEELEQNLTSDEFQRLKCAVDIEGDLKDGSRLLIQTVRGKVTKLIVSFMESLRNHKPELAAFLEKDIDQKFDEDQNRRRSDTATSVQSKLSYEEVKRWVEESDSGTETLRLSYERLSEVEMLSKIEGLQKGTLKNLCLERFTLCTIDESKSNTSNELDHVARLRQYFKDNPQLESLRFDNVKFTPAENMKKLELESLENIRHLAFTGMTVDKENLRLILDKNKHLESLILDKCEVTPNILEHITPSIISKQVFENLSLNHNHLGDMSMSSVTEILRKCRLLQTLSLDDNQITDYGVKTLLGFRRELISLSLEGNQISDNGVRIIAKNLYDRGKLRSLNLAGNQIGILGAKVLHEKWNDKWSPCTIDLRHNQIELEYSIFPPRIHVDMNVYGEERVKRIFKRMDNEEKFSHLNFDAIDLGDEIVEELMTRVVKHSTLQTLSLKQNKLSEYSLIHLIRLFHMKTDLEKILVGENMWSDSRYDILERSSQEEGPLGVRKAFGEHVLNTGVKSFKIENVTLDYLDALLLTELGSLELVNVSITNCDIKDKAINLIVQFLANQGRSLESLVISGNKMLDNVPEILLGNLKDLIVRNKFKKLSSLDFHDNNFRSNQIDKLMFSLKKNVLSHLDISENQIGLLSCLALLKAMMDNASLRRLGLRKTGIGDYGVLAISKALIDNKHLEELDISENKITSVPKYVRRFIEKSETLRILNLSMNELKFSNIVKLSRSLGQSSTITELRMRGTQMGINGMKCLAEILPTQKSITLLDISLNKFGLEGLIAFSQGIKRNNKIERLDVSDNNILFESENDLTELRRNISKNNSLRHIDLNHCSLNDSSAPMLTKVLCICEPLKEINMAGNCISTQARVKAERYVQSKHLGGKPTITWAYR